MKNEVDASFVYQIFLRDLDLITYHAIPYESEIEMIGASKYYGYSRVLDLPTTIGYVIQETLTKTKSVQDLYVIQEDGRRYPLLIGKKDRKLYGEIKNFIFHARIKWFVDDFGIDRRVAKKSMRLLKKNHNGPTDQGSDPTDWVKWSPDSDIMAERAGHFTYWMKLDNSKYTDEFIAINACHRKILSIECCRAVERKINDALSSCQDSPPLRITIPTYDLDELKKALDDFITGKIDLEEFCTFVHKR